VVSFVITLSMLQAWALGAIETNRERKMEGRVLVGREAEGLRIEIG